MQTIAHTPAHAQHVPDGWSFPTLTPPQPPQPVAPAVSGGGAAPATVARVRWGRLLPVLAGTALLAFGIWTATSGPTSSTDRTVAGGGASELDVAPATGTDVDAAADAAAATEAGTIDTATSPEAAPAATPPVATPPAAAPRPARGGARGAGARGAGARPANRRGQGARRGATGAGSTNAFATASAGAAGAPGAGAGANGTPTGELPMTGIETWVAAILGVLLLGGGIVVHVNAVRLATTAMLYRRGILLRPVDCARLVSEGSTVPRLRVLVSDLLHRLLEEPAGSDFVSARHAH